VPSADYEKKHINSKNSICLTGVSTNNLKNIDVELPLGKITVVTGVSGSGKSSLVFDTLYGESFRRYVESLSSFARQYIKALPRPSVEDVYNLPPAIAVRQTRSGASNPRSTVGSMTEIFDLLRMLFLQCGKIVCPRCAEIVRRDRPERVAQQMLKHMGEQTVMIAAPLLSWKRMKANDLKFQLESQGFSRLFLRKKLIRMSEIEDHEIFDAHVIIDRVKVEQKQASRIAESCRLAMKIGGGTAAYIDSEKIHHVFSRELICCGKQYKRPTIGLFSYNNPNGACLNCQGFGMQAEINWEKVFPDQDSCLSKEGVASWNFGSHKSMYQWAKKSAKLRGISVSKKFSEYTQDDWKWLKFGSDHDDFSGVRGYFKWLDKKKHKPHYRMHAARWRKYELCESCEGSRLNASALSYQIGPENFANLSNKKLVDLRVWLQELLEDFKTEVVEGQKTSAVFFDVDDRPISPETLLDVFEELDSRIVYLLDVGLGYLNLLRRSRTLSGGELQRIHLARCLGSSLTDTLYCLDEPTSGLHARDSERLLGVLNRLRDQGNTVVVVEHEKKIIDGADHLITIGPDAGHLGGGLVESTAAHVDLKWPFQEESEFSNWLEIKDAAIHNLKSVTTRFPLGAMTVVCGVSGSGKSSLVEHCLYPLLEKYLRTNKSLDAEELEIAGLACLNIKGSSGGLGEAVLVSQTSIGRSSRSNIATYLGLSDAIRKTFAADPVAKALKLTASSFSFNTSGGRCENCKGLGVVSEDLSFLGDMLVTCPVCEGQRFDSKVLQVRVKNKNLIDVLGMTVLEAREFFYDRKEMTKALDFVVKLGLGYISLGQTTSSFSGGEAQRLKLIKLIHNNQSSRPTVLIFDEPSTGLADSDVQKLLEEFYLLRSMGHTIIVVEHHLGIIASGDWVVEIGPDAAESGGQVVFEGSAREFRAEADTLTSRQVKEFLGE
jgi:excinuclease ABC subunit A